MTSGAKYKELAREARALAIDAKETRDTLRAQIRRVRVGRGPEHARVAARALEARFARAGRHAGELRAVARDVETLVEAQALAQYELLVNTTMALVTKMAARYGEMAELLCAVKAVADPAAVALKALSLGVPMEGEGAQRAPKA